MTGIDQIEADFRLVNIFGDRSELYLRPADADRFLTRARELELAILGLEGFIITPGATQPRLSWIFDAQRDMPPSEWEQFLSESHAAVSNLMKSWISEGANAFSFVLMTREDVHESQAREQRGNG